MDLEEGNVVVLDRTGTGMEIDHSDEEAKEMGTLKKVVVLEIPSGSKDDMKMEPGAGVDVEVETGIKYFPRSPLVAKMTWRWSQGVARQEYT